MDQFLHAFFSPLFCRVTVSFLIHFFVLPLRSVGLWRVTEITGKSTPSQVKVPEKKTPSQLVKCPSLLRETYNTRNSHKMHCIRHGTCNNSPLSFSTWHPHSLHPSSHIVLVQHRRAILQQRVRGRPAGSPLLQVQHLRWSAWCPVIMEHPDQLLQLEWCHLRYYISNSCGLAELELCTT